MTTEYETELVFRVFDREEGAAVTVRPSRECRGNVELYVEPEFEHYFGKFRLDLPAAYMKLIGQVLIDCADVENKK